MGATLIFPIELTDEWMDEMWDTLLSSAFSGIAYWADELNIRDKVADVYWADDEGCVCCEGRRSKATLTPETALYALAECAKGDGPVGPRVRGYAQTVLLEGDLGMLDSDLADCVVQTAVFGKIVYG